MEAALHNEKFREKLGIPRDVAEDYVNADKRTDNWRKRNKAAQKAAFQLLDAVIEHLKYRKR